MGRAIITALVFFLISLTGIGLLVMTFSGTSFDAQIRTGLRALGTSLLMLGIGELFNHPNLHKQLTAGTDPEMGEPITLPWRKPCGLGNLLLVLSIIMFFISLSYLFFQKG